MKLSHAIQHILKQKNPVISNRHMTELESRILRDLPIQQSFMEKQKTHTSPFAKMRPYMTTTIAFALLIMAILGIFGFIQFQSGKKEQAKNLIFIKPATAQEFIIEAEKVIGKRFYYKRVDTQTCSTNPKDYDQFFLNEGGQYEENISMRKRIEECIRNNGKLITKQKVWVDKTNNIVRLEDEISDWQVPDGHMDKQGRERMEEVTPVKILKGDFIYKFYAVGEKTNIKGLREGVYVEEKIQNQKWEEQSFNSAKKTSEEMITYIFENYKDPKKGKVEFEETDNYYKLQLFMPYWKDPNHSQTTKPDSHYLFSENIFEKKTLKPIKTVQYDFNAVAERTVFGETHYEDFTTEFDSKVFDLNIAPEGYMFVQGAPSSFDIITSCEKCKYGDKLTYLAIPHTYKNEEGKDVSYPSNFFNGRVITPLNLKIYESKERFETKEEAKKANNLSFYQLQKTEENDGAWVKNDLFYKSETKIGTDERYSQIKVEAFDQTGEKKIGESINVATVPYSSYKLSDSGNLKFLYMTADDNDYLKQTLYSPYYTWKNYEIDEITIVLFKPENIDEWINSRCTENSRHNNEYQTEKCSKKNEGEIIEITEGNSFVNNNGDKADNWTKSELFYKNISMTIQFNATFIPETKQRCGEEMEEELKIIEPNIKRIQCRENIISHKEKEEIMKEAKILIKKVAEEWK